MLLNPLKGGENPHRNLYTTSLVAGYHVLNIKFDSEVSIFLLVPASLLDICAIFLELTQFFLVVLDTNNNLEVELMFFCMRTCWPCRCVC